ncbi:GH25 family lysozyme [Liquorilactobacillus capillatus]|uniref:GH25 family lysozyme n=1 Tax=Liquorilactobacillus capillatus TaxID=480931 RepID=UPI0012EE50DF|nr:GH25 family lysozyme [Liquorilactobacillus capillatus]
MVAPFLWANSAHAMTQSVTQPRADMVDVSSNNGYVSVSDYQQMKSQGVKAVVVKATEGDWYKNPYAKSQAQNADKAGLALNFYHFSHLTSVQDSINEANYFANYVKSITSDKHVVMVNDSESTALYYTFAQNNLFNDIFYKQLNKLGYYSTDLYTSESWNNYHFSTNSANKGWIAGYPGIPTGTRNSTNNSWQWGSDFQFWNMLGRNFDVSQNYNDKYYHVGTSNASSPAQAIHNGTATATTDKLNAGDTVYIKTAANKYYGSNTTIPKFAKNKNYHVLSASGNRVVIKEIMSAVNRTDVVKVQAQTQSISNNVSGTFNDDGYTINRENGTFTAKTALRVFAYPGVKPTGATYYPGESVKYDGYYVRGNYVYISYVNCAGYHHYIAVRENGVPLGTFR